MLNRKVPWKCVEVTWEWLKGPTRPETAVVGNWVMAWATLVEKVNHMLQCLEPGWTKPDWPENGEL